MKEHMNNDVHFSEALLQQYAEQQDVQTLAKSLEYIRTDPSSVNPELLSRLNVVGVHLELIKTFGQASSNLHDVKATRPTATQAERTEPVDLPLTMGQGAAFEDSLTEYLRGLQTDSSQALLVDGKLTGVQAALQDEAMQQHVFRKLQKLDQMTIDAVRAPIERTVEYATENLWEVVTTGRDFAGLIHAPETPGLDVLIADWQESIDYNFPAAQKLLDGANQWLANN